MQNAALASAHVDGVYMAFEVAPGRLADALRGFEAAGVVGVNITVPHKEEAWRLVDERTPEAEAAGAVNTIAFRGGRLYGHNTDGAGFIRAAEKLAGSLTGKRVLLLGAGGAARGVGAALYAGGVQLVLGNRTREKLAGVAHEWHADVVAWRRESLSEAAGRVDLVVNASSAGMHGKGEIPLDWEKSGAKPAVIDLVYAPLETELLSGARRAGCRTQDGLAMLVGQGELAFAFWTGSLPPEGVMDDALRRFLKG